MTRAVRVVAAAAPLIVGVAACADARSPKTSGADAAIHLDAGAPDAHGGSDAAGSRTDGAAEGRMDGGFAPARCSNLSEDDFYLTDRNRTCEEGGDSVDASICEAGPAIPALSLLGRDLCAEATASESGEVQLEWNGEMRPRPDCDGMKLTEPEGTGRLRVEFGTSADMARRVLQRAPYTQAEIAAIRVSAGCIVGARLRSEFGVVVAAQFPPGGGVLRFGATQVAHLGPVDAEADACGTAWCASLRSLGGEDETHPIRPCGTTTFVQKSCGDLQHRIATGCGTGLHLLMDRDDFTRACH